MTLASGPAAGACRRAPTSSRYAQSCAPSRPSRRLELGSADEAGLRPFLRSMVEHVEHGWLESHVLHRGVELRCGRSELFAGNDYVPSVVRGPVADHVIAFGRRSAETSLVAAAVRRGLTTTVTRSSIRSTRNCGRAPKSCCCPSKRPRTVSSRPETGRARSRRTERLPCHVRRFLPSFRANWRSWSDPPLAERSKTATWSVRIFLGTPS